MASNGKSGAYFFISHDNMLILKSLKPAEARYLRQHLQRYFEHMDTYETTSLLNKFFGMHKISFEVNRQRIEKYFVVQESIF